MVRLLLKISLLMALIGHAHNDYQHPHPLQDALHYGFTSVEADVHLVDGQLLVGHSRRDCRPDRTLQSLYLDPLQANHRQITLIVDLKTGGETYAVLRGILLRYSSMLAAPAQPGQVTVLLTGNRPPDAVLQAESPRYAAQEGVLEDLARPLDPTLEPQVSGDWRTRFDWRGQGPFEEGEKLRQLVEQAHRRGVRLRLWGAPDLPACWDEQRRAGVDVINTDDLAGFASWLKP